jgi:aspartate aminotransferase
MPLRHADRLDSIEESATIAVAAQVRRLRQEGITVADLGGGDPDFPTPAHIVEAASQAMVDGFTHYTPPRGVDPLLTAIAHSLRTVEGLDYDAQREILVTPSAKHAIFLAMLATVNPGDEVLVLSPTWVSHDAIVKLVGGHPVALEMPLTGDLQTSSILEKVTPKTKVILLNSPSNPTGRILSHASLEAISSAASSRDLLIVSDEIYNRITYDGRQAESIAGVDGAFDRTLTINGFSKTYAMTGWRLGYLAGPADLLGHIVKAAGHTVGCAASFSQVGAVAALEGPQDCVAEMVRRYDIRRRRLVSALDSLPGVRCSLPEGAFYAWADISATGLGSDADFSAWLLEVAHVATTPGSAFGLGGAGHIRLSFANSDTVIDDAIERIDRAFRSARRKDLVG